jgi:hypothetical protein
MLTRILAPACALLLCACAAREVTPVAMAQPGDDALSCEAIHQQIADNSLAEAKYIKKDKAVADANVAKQVAGVIPIAGIAISASTDLSNVEQIQARALADRNERLTQLAKQKGCPT